MKYSKYYENVLAGINLFQFNKFNNSEYSKWIKDCSDWLTDIEAAATIIAEWQTLDNDEEEQGASLDNDRPSEKVARLYVKGVESKSIAKRGKLDDDDKSLLDNISKRFLWLAKFSTGLIISSINRLSDQL